MLFGRSFKLSRQQPSESAPLSEPSSATRKPDDPTTFPPEGKAKPRIEKNGLYLILWGTPDPQKYHWGLLIAIDEFSGILFHQTLSGDQWKLTIENKNVEFSRKLLTALKLGVIQDTNDEWIDAIKARIREYKVDGEEFTCRTWALAAIYEFASEGFIGLSPDWKKVRGIEREAKALARSASDIGDKIFGYSEFSEA